MASELEPFHWPQFYELSYSDEDLRGIDGYDAIAESYLADPGGLADLIPNNERNFIRVPSKARKVLCLHMNTIIEEKLIGIYGSRRGSPLHEINISDAARPMTVSHPTRSKDGPTMLPTTDISTTLSSISGTSDIPVSDLERWSNSLWVHPAIFTKCLSSTRETKADTVTQAVMNIMNKIPDRKKEALKLLTFLWAVDKGYAKAVKTRVPPNLPEVNESALLVDTMISNAKEKARPKIGRESTEDDPNNEETRKDIPRPPSKRKQRG
jgi:hypothetical protein